jgi:hypothetical protein
LFTESKLPDGSSASITEGLLIKARATATLCCSPPESCPGLCSILSESFKKSSIFFASVSASLFDRPFIYAGIQTFSKAVNSANK